MTVVVELNDLLVKSAAHLTHLQDHRWPTQRRFLLCCFHSKTTVLVNGDLLRIGEISPPQPAWENGLLWLAAYPRHEVNLDVTQIISLSRSHLKARIWKTWTLACAVNHSDE